MVKKSEFLLVKRIKALNEAVSKQMDKDIANRSITTIQVEGLGAVSNLLHGYALEIESAHRLGKPVNFSASDKEHVDRLQNDLKRYLDTAKKKNLGRLR